MWRAPCLLHVFLVLSLCGVNANEAFQAITVHGISLATIFPYRHSCHHFKRISDKRVFRDRDDVLHSCLRNKSPIVNQRSLLLRGGASFLPGKEALTFSQSLAGSAFSLLSVMYGIACGLAPVRTSRLLYGYDESDNANSSDVGRFLMRLMGAMACGIGLTAAFAIAAELKVLGRVPTPESFAHAIGIGLLPRMLMIVPTLFTGMPSALRINRTDAVVGLIHSAAFGISMFTGLVVPRDSVLCLEVAFHLLLGPLIFFRPAILFQPSTPPSRHEKFMTRLVASYSVMGAVMLMGLQRPDINALPAIGMAAVAYVASLIHLIFVRKDMKQCGSVTAHIIMMIIGAAVAAEGLRHYIW